MSERVAHADDPGASGAGPKRPRKGPLSKREREVFELLAEGLSGAQIAQRLVLSPETVRTHIRNAMGKLGASTRSQALVIALRRNEISHRAETGDPAPSAAAAAKPRPLSGRGLSAPLEAVIDGLLSLWDVDAGWIFLASDDGLGLRRMVERAGEGAAGLPATIALGEGALGRAALERRSQILQAPGGETGAMIVAPMLDGERLIGVLGLAIRPSRATGRQELLLLQALAGRIAEVIATGGPGVAAGLDGALSGFRASWASATRPL